MHELTDVEYSDLEYIKKVIIEQVDKQENTDDYAKEEFVIEIEPPHGTDFISDSILAYLCQFKYRGYFCVPDIVNKNRLTVMKQEEK